MWQRMRDRIRARHSSFAHREKDAHGKTQKRELAFIQTKFFSTTEFKGSVLYNIAIINTTGHNIK